jgi:glycosyltransferase involved in cell wall biosynthesis
MIKVGFLLNFTVEYKGGINYFKNLFFALNSYHSNDVEIILFVPKNLDASYENLFSPYAKVVRTKILQRKSVSWFLSRVFEKFIGFDPLVFYLLKKNNINCISHSNYVYPFESIKTINWVPDFQYLHYPNLWTSNQLSYVKKLHKEWIAKSDLIVVSSYAAKNDLLSQYKNYADKVKVLHFVSQPQNKLTLFDDNFDAEKLGIKGDFFYLPNQFWSHKNHITVFKAINLLKKKGLEILLVTTGSHNDYRDGGEHFKNLLKYVKDNHLENNVLFLGLVSYSNVFSLMKHSLSIINPSYFEGWSSTVEESKSIDKTIILSDIEVHREQNPTKGIYFNPDDENELANILESIWNNNYTFKDVIHDNQPTLEMRTKIFSDLFYEMIK